MPEIRNPNLESQGSGGGASGGDFRSLILFTFLALAAVMVYQYFQKPAANAPANQTPQPQQQAAQSAQQAQQASAVTSGGGGTGPVDRIAPAAASVGASSETTTTIENEKFRITFTNKGAQVQHWILKHYTDSSGKPLDMVQQQAADMFGLPLSLYTYDNTLTTQLNTALYQPSATGQVLAPNSVSFHYAAGGLDVL